MLLLSEYNQLIKSSFLIHYQIIYVEFGVHEKHFRFTIAQAISQLE
jgi:hypothetical protein